MSFYLLTKLRLHHEAFKTNVANLSQKSNTVPNIENTNPTLSEDFVKDFRRTLFLLNEDEQKDYYNAILEICQHASQDYTQGDLDGHSDIFSLILSINNAYFNANPDNATEQKPIALRIAYLRDDKELGGLSLNFDFVKNQLLLAVVHRPAEATSFNDAIITYMLPQTVGEQYIHDDLLKSLAEQPSPSWNEGIGDTSPEEMLWMSSRGLLTKIKDHEQLTRLRDILSNDALFELIKPIFKTPELLSLEYRLSDSMLLHKFLPKATSPERDFNPSFDRNQEPDSDQQTLQWHVLTYPKAQKALQWNQYRLFFDAKKLNELKTLAASNHWSKSEKACITHHLEVAKKANDLFIQHQEPKHLSDMQLTGLLNTLSHYQYQLETGILLEHARKTSKDYLAHLQRSSDDPLTRAKRAIMQKAVLFLDAAKPKDSKELLSTFAELDQILGEKGPSNQPLLAIRKEMAGNGLQYYGVGFVKSVATALAAVFGFGIGGYVTYQRLFQSEGSRYLKTIATGTTINQHVAEKINPMAALQTEEAAEEAPSLSI